MTESRCITCLHVECSNRLYPLLSAVPYLILWFSHFSKTSNVPPAAQISLQDQICQHHYRDWSEIQNIWDSSLERSDRGKDRNYCSEVFKRWRTDQHRDFARVVTRKRQETSHMADTCGRFEGHRTL